MSTTATPDAPEAEGQHQAEAEERRAAAIAASCRKAKIDAGTRDGLDPEQGDRAAEPPAGLAGKALRAFILEGADLRGQETAAADQRKAAEKAKRGRPTGPKPGSMTSAMVEVCRRRRGDEGISAREALEKIRKRDLAPGLKGKTPHATIGAKFATEAKKKDGLFERVGPGRFKLRA